MTAMLKFYMLKIICYPTESEVSSLTEVIFWLLISWHNVRKIPLTILVFKCVQAIQHRFVEGLLSGLVERNTFIAGKSFPVKLDTALIWWSIHSAAILIIVESDRY